MKINIKPHLIYTPPYTNLNKRIEKYQHVRFFRPLLFSLVFLICSSLFITAGFASETEQQSQSPDNFESSKTSISSLKTASAESSGAESGSSYQYNTKSFSSDPKWKGYS